MAAPRKLTPAKEAQVAQAYEKSHTLSSITERWGVSAGTIRTIAARAGLPLRPVGRPKTKVA